MVDGLERKGSRRYGNHLEFSLRQGQFGPDRNCGLGGGRGFNLLDVMTTSGDNVGNDGVGRHWMTGDVAGFLLEVSTNRVRINGAGGDGCLILIHG